MERAKPKLLENPSLFEELYQLDIKEDVETANFGFGDIPILPWAKAWRIIKTFDADAQFQIYETTTGLPYFETPFGVLVHVGLTIRGVLEKDWYPVEGGKQGMTVRDIADAHQRGLVKCAGRHGLGLSLWEKKGSGPVADNNTHEYSTKTNSATAQTSYDPNWLIPFGKHKGQKISTVAIEDLQSYLAWLETDAAKKGEPLKGNALKLKQMTDIRAGSKINTHKDFEAPPFDDVDLSNIPF